MVLAAGSVPLAEGVEDEAEAAVCIDMGFQLIQGISPVGRCRRTACHRRKTAGCRPPATCAGARVSAYLFPDPKEVAVADEPVVPAQAFLRCTQRTSPRPPARLRARPSTKSRSERRFR